jgi:nitrate reductase cytochrome c-type subunit
MRGASRVDLMRAQPRFFERAGLLATLVLTGWVGGCAQDAMVAVPDSDGGMKSAATVRAERRLYDGAPPVVPHENFGMSCTECHNVKGVEVPGVGFAPPQPHAETAGMSSVSRCVQCHVFKQSDAVFVASDFVGLRQDLRHGARLNPIAPPTIPHKTFMRENCLACHSGSAAREEIRTTHPERVRCRQCHVPAGSRAHFESLLGEGYVSTAPTEPSER